MSYVANFPINHGKPTKILEGEDGTLHFLQIWCKSVKRLMFIRNCLPLLSLSKKKHHSRKSRIPIKLNHLHFWTFYIHIYIFLYTYIYIFNKIIYLSAILFKQFEVFHWISTCYLNAITEDIDISLIQFLSNSKYISFLKFYTQI